MSNEELKEMFDNATKKIVELENSVELLTEQKEELRGKLFKAKLMIDQLLNKMKWQDRIAYILGD